MTHSLKSSVISQNEARDLITETYYKCIHMIYSSRNNPMLNDDRSMIKDDFGNLSMSVPDVISRIKSKEFVCLMVKESLENESELYEWWEVAVNRIDPEMRFSSRQLMGNIVMFLRVLHSYLTLKSLKHAGIFGMRKIVSCVVISNYSISQKSYSTKVFNLEYWTSDGAITLLSVAVSFKDAELIEDVSMIKSNSSVMYQKSLFALFLDPGYDHVVDVIESHARFLPSEDNSDDEDKMGFMSIIPEFKYETPELEDIITDPIHYFPDCEIEEPIDDFTIDDSFYQNTRSISYYLNELDDITGL